MFNERILKNVLYNLSKLKIDPVTTPATTILLAKANHIKKAVDTILLRNIYYWIGNSSVFHKEIESFAKPIVYDCREVSQFCVKNTTKQRCDTIRKNTYDFLLEGDQAHRPENVQNFNDQIKVIFFNFLTENSR